VEPHALLPSTLDWKSGSTPWNGLAPLELDCSGRYGNQLCRENLPGRQAPIGQCCIAPAKWSRKSVEWYRTRAWHGSGSGSGIILHPFAAKYSHY
jgi:hypothetical protein